MPPRTEVARPFYFGGFRVDGRGATPRSGLGEMLQKVRSKRAAVDDLKAFAADARKLKGVTAREVGLTVGFLMRGHNDAAGQRALVHLLEALPQGSRGQALRLIDGQANTRRVAFLVDAAFSDAKLRQRARQLVDEARPAMTTDEPVILSDIDDTVRPSGSHQTSDKRPWFPGAQAFFRALDAGPSGRGVPGDVHFVTARGLSAAASTEHVLRKTGLEWGSIAYGNWDTRLKGAPKLRAIAQSKIENIERLLRRNPRSKAVLLGDDTQADPQVFEEILRRHPGRVGLVLIHRVAGREIPASLKRDSRVVVFDTYADAARAAHKRGLINAAQRDEVVRDR
jgi:hypothetical protein